MDIKPTDEIELEERPEEDTLPDVSEREAETGLDDFSTIEYDLERDNTNAELVRFYDSFPEYKVDIPTRIRNKTKFSLDPETNQLRIRDGDSFVYLSKKIK